MRRIKFGEIDFATEEMFVFSEGAYSAPVRDVSRESVLGRNGDIIVDNDRYENTTARFTVHIREDVDRNIERLKYLLYSQKGYQRLYDSSAKDFYRMACFYDGFEFVGQDRGNVEITFDCKPMKYSIAGDEWVDVPTVEVQSAKLINPFFENAKPLIRIDAGLNQAGTSGHIVFNSDYNGGEYSDHIDFTHQGGQLYIDTETQQAWYTLRDNGYVFNAANIVSKLSIELAPGNTFVRCTDGFSAKIKPRWCTI